MQEGEEEEDWQGGGLAIDGRASVADARPSPAINLGPSPADEHGEEKQTERQC